MEALQRLSRQLAALWSQLGARQRILVIGAGLGAIVLVFGLSTLSSRTSLEPLFADLDPADASAVLERVRDQNLEFEITDGGRAILVQSDRVLDLRLSLAADGVPAGGSVGFGIFDETSFTITDLTQRVNYQRALQGELERTIKGLRAIETARVLLVIPRQSLFIESQQPTTASVMLSVKPGRKLEIGQVAGVRHLVAAAVEGLQTENVTIVDASGLVLDADVTAGDLGATTTQLGIQRAFEQDHASAVQRVIERVIGPNRSVVSVAAEFDWTASEVTREIFEPVVDGAPIARSRQTTTETFSGAGVTPPGGIPGVTSNTSPAGDEQSGTTDENSSYSRTEITENNEINKRVQRDVMAPGRLLSMRVSVLLDASIAEADASAISDAVRNMIDTDRGDVMSMGSVTFNTELRDQAELALTEAAQAEQMANMITMGVVGVVVVAVLFFLWRTLRVIRRGITPATVAVHALEGPDAIRALGVPQRAIEAAYGEAESGTDLGSLRQRMVDEEEEDKNLDAAQGAQAARARTQRQLTDFAKQQPESMVRLLETWMAED